MLRLLQLDEGEASLRMCDMLHVSETQEIESHDVDSVADF